MITSENSGERSIPDGPCRMEAGDDIDYGRSTPEGCERTNPASAIPSVSVVGELSYLDVTRLQSRLGEI